MISVRPRPIHWVARVATKAGTCRYATAKPLTVPTRAPTARQLITVSQTGAFKFVIIYAPMTPVSPTVEPTEISISPIRIASSMPQQIIALTELDFNRFKRFDDVMNFGVEIETMIISRIRPMIVPILRLK